MSSIRNAPFQPGEIVRLVRGHQPQRVLEVVKALQGWRIRAAYLNQVDLENYPPRWRSAADYVKFDYNQVEKKTMTTKLYQIDSLADNKFAGKFGTYLATNSTGQLVLEIKGSGEVHAFSPDLVSEVKPYTVQIRVGGKTTMHFLAKPGVLAKGDVVIFSDGTFGIVQRIDTKQDSGQSLRGARRVVTEALEALAESSAAEEGESDGFFNQPE